MALLDAMYNQVLSSIVIYAPNVMMALALLIFGYVVGKVVYILLRRLLIRAQADKYIRKSNMPKVSEFLPFVTKWYVYLAFISAAFSDGILGIPLIAVWVSTIMGFIPNVIGAALVLFIGYVFGEWLKDSIATKKTLYSEITGNIVLFLVLYVSLAMALSLLSVPTALVENIMLIVVASVGLGMAIAIGLGMKDAVRDVSLFMVKGYTKRKK